MKSLRYKLWLAFGSLLSIVLTIAAVCSLFTIVVMKLLSILMRSSGRRLTWARLA